MTPRFVVRCCNCYNSPWSQPSRTGCLPQVTLSYKYCCPYPGDWPPVTAIPAADLPHCSPCVYITRKSAELKDWKHRTRWNGSSGRLAWVLFQRRAITRKAFLRGISPLKVLPPEDDTWCLVAGHPCGCQAGEVLRHGHMTVSFTRV